jgi:hypothetical protein
VAFQKLDESRPGDHFVSKIANKTLKYSYEHKEQNKECCYLVEAVLVEQA